MKKRNILFLAPGEITDLYCVVRTHRRSAQRGEHARSTWYLEMTEEAINDELYEAAREATSKKGEELHNALQILHELINKNESIKLKRVTSDTVYTVLVRATQDTHAETRITAYATIAKLCESETTRVGWIEYYVPVLKPAIQATIQRETDEQVFMLIIAIFVCVETYTKGLEEPSTKVVEVVKGIEELTSVLLTRLETEFTEATNEQASNLLLAIGNINLPIIYSYITQNLVESSEFHKNAVALLVFSGGLEKFVSVSPDFPSQMVPFLFKLFKVENTTVKIALANTTCDLLENCAVLLPAQVKALVHQCIKFARDPTEPIIVTCGCTGLMRYAEQLEENDEEFTRMFAACVPALMEVSGRTDENEATRQTVIAAYDALNNFLGALDQETKMCTQFVLEKMIPILLARLEHGQTLNENVFGAAFLVLGSCFNKLLFEEAEDIDKYVEFLVKSLQEAVGEREKLQSEIFMAFCHLIGVMGELEVGKYMPVLYPIVLRACEQYQNIQTCSVAFSVIGDLCRNLQLSFTPYSQQFIALSLSLLSIKDLDKTITASIIESCGDVALAIEADFAVFVNPVMGKVLSLEIPDLTPEERDDITSTLCQFFTAIIQGLRIGSQPQAFYPFIDQVAAFVVGIYSSPNPPSENTEKDSIGLFGDIALTFGTLSKHIFEQSKIKEILVNSQTDPETLHFARTNIAKVFAG